VHSCDETSLRGAVEAAEAGLIVPILVGPQTKITAAARENRLDIAATRSLTARTATKQLPVGSN
jgi:phosphotransacetylase